MESSIQRRDSTRDQAIYPPAITGRNRQRGDQGQEQADWEGAEVATSPSSSILTVWTSQISRWIACMPVSLTKENANSRGSKNVQQHLLFIQLFSTPWTAPCQTPLSFTISWSLLKLSITGPGTDVITQLWSLVKGVWDHPTVLSPKLLPQNI